MKNSSVPEIRVILLDISDIRNEMYKEFYNSASQERRKKAERYMRHEDAVRCIMSEALVRYAYMGTGKSAEHFCFAHTAYGKPYLKDDTGFRFNISHSGKYVAAACSQIEVGIDIEQINRTLDRRMIADTVFTPEEKAYIFSSEDDKLQRLRFAELWTAKESYLKYIGTGLKKSPLTVSTDIPEKRIVGTEAVLTGTKLHDDYYFTVCSNTSKIQIEYTEMSVIKKII